MLNQTYSCRLGRLTLLLTLLGLLALVRPAPTHAQAGPGSLDAGFQPGAGFDTGPNRIVVQPDGKILLGGPFTSYDGASRNGVARVNADGSLDPSFNPGPGTGRGGNVLDLALQPDGRVLIVGTFDSVYFTPRNKVARLNADGSLDPSFAPAGRPFLNSFLYAVSLQPDGRLLVGGDFSTPLGNPAPFIARLNADGSLDPGFPAGPGPDRPVYGLALQPDGKILLRGDFTFVDGVLRPGLARLNADGSLDLGFVPGSGVDRSIADFAVQPDGRVLIVGEFTTYDGVARAGVARLNVDGSLDPSFDPAGHVSRLVTAVALQPDGKVLVGGRFQVYDAPARNNLVRLNANGSLDASFDAGRGFDTSARFVLALQADGRVLVGGSFSFAEGQARPGLARLNNDRFLPTVTVVASAPVASAAAGQKGIFALSLSAPAPADLSVSYRIGGTAIPGQQYRALPVSVVVPAGATGVRIKVKALAATTTTATVKLKLVGVGGYVVGSPATAKVKVGP